MIYDEIQAERERQDRKWGERNHHPHRWLVIAGEEYGEACKGLLEGDPLLRYREELIHLAAVCVAAIESLDRGKASLRSG